MKVNKDEFLPVAEECKSCPKVFKHEGERKCEAYINPPYWWTQGRRCPLAKAERLTTFDIASMAIKQEIFIEKEGVFLYDGKQAAPNINGLAQLMNRNKQLLVEVKGKLGIHDGDVEDVGKVRAGQQKQKKG